jgi:hypothetical protein
MKLFRELSGATASTLWRIGMTAQHQHGTNCQVLIRNKVLEICLQLVPTLSGVA